MYKYAIVNLRDLRLKSIENEIFQHNMCTFTELHRQVNSEYLHPLLELQHHLRCGIWLPV